MLVSTKILLIYTFAVFKFPNLATQLRHKPESVLPILSIVGGNAVVLPNSQLPTFHSLVEMRQNGVNCLKKKLGSISISV